MTARSVRIDPDVGLPDLVKSLTDDSKRLVKDEVRLAKLEAAESARMAAKGGMWLGALAVGAIEIGLGLWLIKRGLGSFSEPSYTFEETRAGLKETVDWVGDARGQSRALTTRGNGRH